MKKVLALVLAVVLVFGMTTVAFAAAGSRVSSVDSDAFDTLGASDVVMDDRKTEWDVEAIEVSHGKEFRIYLNPDMFGWDKGVITRANIPATESMTLSNLSSVTVRASWKKGGEYFNAPVLKYDSNAARKTVYICLEAKKGITVTSDKDIDGKIILTYKSGRAELNVSGQTKVTEGATIFKDDESAWINKDQYIKAEEFVKDLEVNFEVEDVRAYLNVFGGKKYYIFIQEDVQTKDEEIIAKYDSIEAVYHAYYSSNVNVPSTYVVFDIDETYYIYDGEGKYVGLTTDKQVPLRSVYYLSTKKLDDLEAQAGEEPGEAPAEQPTDVNNPDSGGDDGVAENEYGNPNTGSNGFVSFAVVAGLVALAAAGISKK